MAIVMKKCRVCGKEYKPCHTVKSGNTFRWQDVACSPECGSIYLSQVNAARSQDKTINESPTSEPPTLWSEDDEQYEAELAEYFDDETND